MEHVDELNKGILLYGEKWGEYSILNILTNEKNESDREKIIVELITSTTVPLKIVIIGSMKFWTSSTSKELGSKNNENAIKKRLDAKFFNDVESITSIVKCCFLCNKFLVYDWVNSYYPSIFSKANLLLVSVRKDRWLDDIEKMERFNPEALPSPTYFTTIKNTYLC